MDNSKAAIVRAGLVVARRMGYDRVPYHEVAASLGMAVSGIQHHFPSIKDLQGAILAEAVRTLDAQIMAQGFSLRDSRLAHLGPGSAERKLAAAFVKGV